MSMVFDVVSPPPRTACSGGVSAQEKQGLFSSCFPSLGDGRSKAEFRLGFGFGSEKLEEEASSESSSIGVPDDSDGDDGEEEVQSKPEGSLGSLASLEDTLPIKRGLSNSFSGKSKSFANLTEVSRVEDLKKKENPLNKRRRTMIAYKWSKKSAFYGCGNNSSMPLLALNEEEDEEKSDLSQEEDDDDEDEADRRRQIKVSKSCFSLTDLRK